MSRPKRCPECHREFEPQYSNCPFDGEVLLEEGAANADPLLGRRLADTYQLQRRLGAGGMGAVYQARHVRLDTGFAIKVLRPELTIHADVLARFHREARAACQLKQPNIINVFDVNKTEDGIHYIVQELLEGESLADFIRRESPADLARGVPIITQICDAMAAAHAKNIIHRDLKPENVFLCEEEDREEPFVKVLDFGIAKVLEAGTQLTTPADVMGTPYFMAPEQATGSGKADARSDVYSLGVIVYQLFTACLPFPETDARAVLALIQVRDPVPPRDRCPDLPPALEALILRAMSRVPDARFQTMAALRDALQQVAAGADAAPDPRTMDTEPPAALMEVASQSTLPAPTGPEPAGTGPATPAPVVPETLLQGSQQQPPTPAPMPPTLPAPAPGPAPTSAPDSFLKGQVEPAAGGGSKRWVLIFVAVVLAVGLGGGVYYKITRPPAPKVEPKKEAAAGGEDEPDREGEDRPKAPDEKDHEPAPPIQGTSKNAPDAPDTPPGMTLVKGGAFTMGYDDGSPKERPAHPCEVADFHMDVREVTRLDFHVFLSAPAGKRLRKKKQWARYSPRPGEGTLPVTSVTWAEADLYCRSQPGRKLPTEAQWEFAARGPTHAWLYPGGDQPPAPEHANFARRKGAETAPRPASKPLHGFSDLCGNAAEWVDDRLSVYTGAGCKNRERPARKVEARFRVIRGGGYDDHDLARLRATYRLYQDPKTFRWKSLGFRCVKEIKRP